MAKKKNAEPKSMESVSNKAEGAKALDRTLQQIEKTFGSGAIMRLGLMNFPEIQGIPTGSLSLDVALGGKGLPKGRIIEVYGPESSGKTTLSLHAIASAQKAGGVAAFIDAEHALDPSYAKKLGVELDNLLVSQPDTGEQALEIVEYLVRSNALDIIVVDSVAALTPRAEIEGDMGDTHVGLQARLMSQALRKLTAIVHKSNVCVIFINQIRMKIGVMFGNPETTPGGKSLKFYSSVRLEIRRISGINTGQEIIGNRVRVKVVKNKVAPPFRQAEFDILFNSGISYEGDVLDLAVEKNIVEKSGAWFSYAGNRLGQGRENARDTMKANPAVLQEITDKVMESFRLLAESGSHPSPSPKKPFKAPGKSKAEEEEEVEA